MAVVGSAEIVVRAVTSKVKDDIVKAFRDARPAIAAEGESAGAGYLEGFKKSLESGLGNIAKDAFSSGDMAKAAGEGGQQAGSAFNSGMKDEVGKNLDLGDGIRSATESAMTDADRAVSDGAAEIGNTAEREMTKSGNRGGKGFVAGFLASDFAKEASHASEAFTAMMGSSNILGPAISALVSSLSAAASGLFSMASAAGVAVGALGALPGMMLAAAQGVGVLKLAFLGVSKAVSAGFKAAVPAVAASTSAVASANRAIQAATTQLSRARADADTRMATAREGLGQAELSASRSMQDAREALSKAYQSASDAMAAANQKVADANANVRSSQDALAASQRDLNAARKDAIEQLQQLAFSAESASLAEERAGLNLQDAHAALVKVQNLPPDNRARIDATLAFKEADLAYREAKDRNHDLSKQQAAAAKSGVEGTKTVIDAHKRVNDAQKTVNKAEEELAKARNDRAKTERDNQQSIADAERKVARVAVDNAKSIGDAEKNVTKTRLENARAIADAQRALTDAQQRLKEAQKGSAATANAYQKALASLSPPAREFVKYLVSQKKAFDALKTAAGTELFPRLTVALKDLITNVLPVLQTGFRVTGRLIGVMAEQIANVLSHGDGFKNFKKLIANNNEVLDIFVDRNKKGQSAVSSLMKIFLRLGVAVGPITERFAKFITHLLNMGASATKGQNSMDKMQAFFKKAGDRAALLGDIVLNIIKIIGALGKAADPAGVGLLKSFDKATAGLNKFLRTPKEQKILTQFFKDTAWNLRQIGKLVDTIGTVFLGLGDNKGVGKFADSLRPAAKIIGNIGDKLTSASPALGPFVTQIAKLIDSLTQTSQVNTFIKTLTFIVTAANNIIHWFGKVANAIDGVFKKFTGVDNITGKIGVLVLGLMAVHRAIAFAMIPIKFFFMALTGGPINAIKAIKNIFGLPGQLLKFFKGAFGSIVGLFGRLKTAMGELRKGNVGEAFKAMKKGSDEAKSAIEEQMVTDKEKTKVLKKLATAAENAGAALELFKEAAKPLAGELHAIGENAATALKRGFEDGSTGFIDAMVTVAKDAVTAVKDELGIKSPSKVFMKVGEQAGEGYVLGLEEAQAAARKAGASLGDASLAGVKSASGGAPTPEGGGKGAAGDAGLGKFSKSLDEVGGKKAGIFAKSLGGISSAFKGLGGSIMGLTGGPFGLLMIALPLIIKGFELLYKKSPAFRAFVDGVVSKLKELANWFGNKILPILNDFFQWVNKNLPKVGAFFSKVFGAIGRAIGTFVQFFKDHWKTIAAIIITVLLGPMGLLVVLFIKNFGRIKDAFHTVVGKIQDGANSIKNFFSDLRGHIADIINKIKDKFDDFISKVKSIFHTAITREINGAKNTFTDFRDKIRTVVDWIKGKFDDFRDKVVSIFRTFLTREIQGVKNIWQGLQDKFHDVFAFIKGRFDNFRNNMADLAGAIRDKVDKIKGMFGEIGDKVASVFGSLGHFAKAGINKFIDFMNSGLISKINSVTKHFGLKIGSIPRLATGGPVEGPGGPTQDNLPHLLSNGEYVVKAKSVSAIGQSNMDYINKTGKLPGTTTGTGGFQLPHFHMPNLGDLKDLFKEGVGLTLSHLVGGAEDLMSAAGIKRGLKGDFSLDNFFYAIMDKLKESAKNWGQKKDDKHAQQVAAALFEASATGGTTPADLWRSLRSVGFSKVQTAGVMGNMQSESGLSPTIIQGGGHSLNPADAGGGGYGLVQWTPGRKLIPYLHGKKPSIQSEVNALRDQLSGKGPSPETLAGKALRNAATVAEAAKAFQMYYERTAGGLQPARVRQAEAFYARFKNLSSSTHSMLGGMAGSRDGGWTYPLNHRYGITQMPNQGHSPPWAVDIGAPTGTGVRAASTGVVELVRNLGNTSYGRYIKIAHQNGIETLYAHLSRFLVRKGQRVLTGQGIGFSGASGHVTGPHLHFELMPSHSTVDAMRARGVRLAKGGIVPATPGGILSVIGEAGKNERVEPLGRDGFSARDRAMIDLIKETLASGRGKGGGDVINVYPSPGMNEIELANLVSRRVAWKRRPGT